MAFSYDMLHKCEEIPRMERPGVPLPAIKIPDHIGEREKRLISNPWATAVTLSGTAADFHGGCRSLVDLTNYSQYRICGVATTGAGAATTMRLQYSPDNVTFTDMQSVDDVSVAAAATNKEFKSAWTVLPAGAKAEVWLRISAKKAATETCTLMQCDVQYR